MTEEQRRKREFRPVGKEIRAKRARIQAQKRIRFANGLLADSLGVMKPWTRGIAFLTGHPSVLVAKVAKLEQGQQLFLIEE